MTPKTLVALRPPTDINLVDHKGPPLTRVVSLPFAHQDPGKDWEIRKVPDPTGVFDVCIMCEDYDEAYKYLQEVYKAQPCAMYEESGIMVWRLQCGLFVVVSNKLASLAGTTYTVWDWIGKFTTEWDLEILRYKQQLREIRTNSLN